MRKEITIAEVIQNSIEDVQELLAIEKKKKRAKQRMRAIEYYYFQIECLEKLQDEIEDTQKTL